MTKALFKKQLMEVFSWLFQDKKSGKIRSKGGVIGFAILYLVLFGCLGSIFYVTANMLCAPLYEIGFGWLYFALMGLVAVALGVFGSVFNTYSTLYQAKDNDLLLSLPLPPAKILLARLSGVFVMGLMYELIVMIPTLLVFFLKAKVTVAGGVFALLSPFILSVLVLVLSCILGFGVALVSSKLKRKNIITVILSLVFLAAYYYLYAQAYKMLEMILANPQKVADSVKSALYPFYCMGRGAEGDFLSMLIFTGIMAALFVLVYLVLARSFLHLATANRGTAKKKYKEKTAKRGTADSALLQKEFRRFLSSSIYMLNCGLGIVFMLIAAVALLIKGAALREMIYGMFEGYLHLIPLFCAAAVCMITTMCDMTSPSVSLEGKNLWLVQVLPIHPFQPLKAKLKLHLYLTLPPTVLLTLAVEWVFRLQWVEFFLLLVTDAAFVLFMALVGLFFNLKLPNLTWTNEVVPVKQSMSVTLALFGGWVVVLAFGVLYYALRNLLSPVVFLAASAVLLIVLSAVLYRYIKTKGAKIFETL
ncbi:MAG: hypothetical protein Q4E21_09310 [Clostridia bacterium]|nr:hypothetical protein [Clostridia bacterium]